jgi:S-methylmethionine-dependent homocysteine/selenocysteine methylase
LSGADIISTVSYQATIQGFDERRRRGRRRGRRTKKIEEKEEKE